jgi:hypothetical protein
MNHRKALSLQVSGKTCDFAGRDSVLRLLIGFNRR